ncbi:chalcone isomerase family protein [Massilia soli]|uniref:Chalcone isomerase family protein n=1 Tax=Massilia soli TaxID=2792854 RepID=A0ABS7SLT6_9BURK|nr:chalcone isomerase family protein [Massilia soli]MBZ2206238.1 chalcone isomerase family protein [Massilia soli]
MIASKNIGFKSVLTGLALACSLALPALAAEINGVKFADTVKVGGSDLKLNGLGMRTKVVFKVYAAGLYLTEKKTTPADILAVQGPRRVTLVMMRDLTSDEFGQAFMTGLNNNLSQAEKTKIVSQISKFGEMFASIDGLKKGDVLNIDWIPATGTQTELNGKKIGETVPDVAFYNAILRIWIGDKPADSSLKPALLGAKS